MQRRWARGSSGAGDGGERKTHQIEEKCWGGDGGGDGVKLQNYECLLPWRGSKRGGEPIHRGGGED